MKLATVRVDGRTEAVRVDDTAAVELGFPDVGTLLRHEDWQQRAEEATGALHDTAALDYAPLVPRPSKIICVGLNYRAHILEVGQSLPEYPTLFAKFAPALIGAFDDIRLPDVAEQMDWEAELCVVVGANAYLVNETRAKSAIAGYTVANDVSARDWQMRTTEWLQGKTFARTTPVGPCLVTPDEAGPAHEITCEVGGKTMQKATTGDLVFGPAELVSYISTILPLEPGDLIMTGTPSGVGFALSPQRFLTDGEEVVTRISGVGECRNTCRRA
ncbi:fumarylacetoacetate hydrolase family protein [Streptomyces sp. NPDC002144]